MLHTKLGAIFDLDGTLLDSMKVWEEIDFAFLEKRGIELPPDYLKAISALGFERAAEYTLERFQLSEAPKQIVAEWKKMAVEAYRDRLQVKPFAAEYLCLLRQKGIRIALATASSEELYLPALENNHILQYFDSFTTLNEVNRGKGFPDIYCKAAEKLGLFPKQCMVFEDILTGIQGANAGGFFTIGVAEPSSAYEWEAIMQQADHYIYSFQELLEP